MRNFRSKSVEMNGEKTQLHAVAEYTKFGYNFTNSLLSLMRGVEAWG
jgi:hypothetical protein